MVITVAGGPEGLDDTDRWPARRGNRGSVICGTTPTKCKRPFGAKAERYGSRLSSGAAAVDRIKLNDPAALLSSSFECVSSTWCAPIFRASSAFAAELVNAVTSHPHLCRN